MMFKLRIGFFFYQHKLFFRPSASILKTPKLAYCSKATCSSLVTNGFIKPNCPVMMSTRTFWETFPASGRSFHAKDKLDRDKCDLVYRSKLFNYAFYGQLVSELTFLAQIGYGLHHVVNHFLIQKVIPLSTTLGSFTVTYDIVAMGAITLFTIQNGLVFIAAQKGLLRVYHKEDTDEYIFISLALNPFKNRKVICKPGELKTLHSTNKLASFIKGNFEVKNQRYFLRHEHFKNNYHFNRLVYEDY